MNEARQFIRYVTPGFVFVTESLLLLWLLRPDLVIAHLRLLDNVGDAIGVVFVSSGLGFIFSVIHHQCHWAPWPRRFWGRPAINHLPCVQRLEKANLIAFEPPTPAQSVDEHDAWIIASVLWEERLTTSEILKGSERALANIYDFFYAVGAARVAAFASPLAVLFVAAENSDIVLQLWPILRCIAAVLIALVWITVLRNSSRRLGCSAEMTLEQALTDALFKERREQRFAGYPLKIRVPLREHTRHRSGPLEP